MGSLAPYDLGNQLSARVISAARAIYLALGSGHTEAYYRRLIANELRQQRLEVATLFPVDAWQNGELAEIYFVDLFVEWQVVVQINTGRSAPGTVEVDEMHACLIAASAPMGVLLNFGRRKLEYERVFAKQQQKKM